jgi:molecular chaperone GrpE
MKFKNIFKNKSTMTTENRNWSRITDDATLENNKWRGNIVEELSVEEQLTQDLAKKKKTSKVICRVWKFTKKKIKNELSCSKQQIKKFVVMLLF